MHLPFTLQIPVFNETAALSFSAYYFNKIGIRPRYILDSQRTIEAENELIRLGYEPLVFENDKPYIENGYETFARSSPTDWILRLDCDELPSLRLLAACSDFVRADPLAIAGFDRHQVLWHDDVLLSAKADRFDPVRQRQWRLFNRTRVRFDTHIHTSGLCVEEAVAFPPEACAYHLAWEFLTWHDRLKKSDRYDAYGQPAVNRQNQLLPIEDAQLAPFDAPILHEAYLAWRPAPNIRPELVGPVEGQQDGFSRSVAPIAPS